MKFRLIWWGKQGMYNHMWRLWCLERVKVPLVLLVCSILFIYWGLCPIYSDVSSDESLPLPQKDDAFGISCPPGFCRIPEGYMMGLRDKPLGIHFMDEKRGWIVGNFGLGLKTEDGGKSWQKVSFSEEDSFKDVFFSGEKGWLVGERGVILHTADGGQTWERQSSNNKNSLLSVFFINSNKGFIVGGDGTILRTEDAGSSWQGIELEWGMLISEDLQELGVVSVNLYDVFFLTDTLGWIVGDAGTVLHTQDGGLTWDMMHMAPVPPLFSVYFRNPRDGFAVGSHGYCIKTCDGGQSWKKFNIGTENSLYKVVFHDDTGVVVGDLATTFKTADGGLTWVKVPNNIPPPYPWFVDVCILANSPIRALTIGKSIIINTEISSKK